MAILVGFLLLGLLIVGYLLFQWQVTANQWISHGCTSSPYWLALTQGAPAWFEYCTNGGP